MQMCQVSPGPRCWSDSNATARSLQQRLKTAEGKLTSVRSEKNKAASDGDLTRFGKFRKEEEKLVVRVNDLRRDVRHNQRDIDGTKTGLRKLDEAIAVCEDPKQLRELEARRAQAEAIRVARSHALATLTSGVRPMLRIAA
jgi:chromosome segregation ATPase